MTGGQKQKSWPWQPWKNGLCLQQQRQQKQGMGPHHYVVTMNRSHMHIIYISQSNVSFMSVCQSYIMDAHAMQNVNYDHVASMFVCSLTPLKFVNLDETYTINFPGCQVYQHLHSFWGFLMTAKSLQIRSIMCSSWYQNK